MGQLVAVRPSIARYLVARRAAKALRRSARLWPDRVGFDLRREGRGAGGRKDEVAEAEALANWVALHKRRFRETDSNSERRTK